MENLSEKALEYLALYGFNVLAALLIFIVGRFVADIVSKIIEKAVVRSSKDITLANFVKHISYIGLLILVIIAAVSKLGIQTASLVAVIGAAGLAVGLALQGSLANFAAGILLIIFKPFKIGDLVETAGVIGIVKEIHIFCSTVNTLDNKRVIIPNAKITGDNITNLSDIDKRRIDFVFGISYCDDMKEAKNACRELFQPILVSLKNLNPPLLFPNLQTAVSTWSVGPGSSLRITGGYISMLLKKVSLNLKRAESLFHFHRGMFICTRKNRIR